MSNFSESANWQPSKTRPKIKNGRLHLVETKLFYSLVLDTIAISRSIQTWTQCCSLDKKQTNGTSSTICSVGKTTLFRYSSTTSSIRLNLFTWAKIRLRVVKASKKYLLESIHLSCTLCRQEESLSSRTSSCAAKINAEVTSICKMAVCPH